MKESREIIIGNVVDAGGISASGVDRAARNFAGRSIAVRGIGDNIEACHARRAALAELLPERIAGVPVRIIERRIAAH